MEEDHKADFEDQSFYTRDGRSLMELMLPPRPARPPDASLQGKIVQFHRLRREGRAKSINEKIRHARNFKNPYMLNWLVSHCGIDETGSNYPKELFDPAAIRREAAEVMERQKRQKAAAQQNRTAIDFTTGEGAGSAGLQAGGVVVPGGAAAAVGLGIPRPIVKVVEGTKRPRSKWDQGEPAAGAKPGASQPAATTTTTTSGSRYAEYALAKKAEIEAKLRQK